jgi:hypothetical protein
MCAANAGCSGKKDMAGTTAADVTICMRLLLDSTPGAGSAFEGTFGDEALQSLLVANDV